MWLHDLMSFLIDLCLELQQSILEHLSDSPEALSSIALSCQSLHEPATSILWRRVEGFQQIASLFPEDNPLRISPFSLSEYQNSRDFTEDELGRISHYCNLVRHVERVYTEDLCLMLEKLPSDRFPYLFPNLRSIECQHLWTRGSDRILSPSVVRNCFTTRGYHTWSIDPFMIPIAIEEESYPLLTHLEFQLFNRAFRGEFALITRCPNLQYLEVFSADGPIMNHLAQLPNLRVLRFLSLEEMPPTFHTVAPFPSLVELFLGETTAQSATSFLHAVSSSSLTTIQVELKDRRISSVSLDAMVHSLDGMFCRIVYDPSFSPAAEHTIVPLEHPIPGPRRPNVASLDEDRNFSSLSFVQ
ncbi:unnamed protein product [Mycena citricolor]|uniref:F-box domain-containing protein n=1 Tax=Mycena citricolor TaxID=2018698 RepID=A0AAD2HB73_9AGAR|nr:unnamed protein product [Mycena citricolor]